MNLLPKFPARGHEEDQAKINHSLLKREAEIGGQLFGPISEGQRRQFFCLDTGTWIWYEEWRDEHGERQFITTRYEIRQEGITKLQDGQAAYQRLTLPEARHLYKAIKLYCQRVRDDYQRLLQAT